MTRAEINVDDLRDFIGKLQQFNSDIETSWSSLNARWQQADESWRDQKKGEFTDDVGWESVIRIMQGYISTSQEYLNYLKNLEQRATDYLESH